MSEIVIVAEALKLITALYFQKQRQEAKTEEEIRADFLAIGDEAAVYNPDNLVDV